MLKKLYKNSNFALIVLFNLVSALGLLGGYYQAYASDSPASNPLVWCGGFFIMAHLVMVIRVIQKNAQQEADDITAFTNYKNQRTELCDEQKKIIAELKKAKADLATKERVLKEVTDKARVHKEHFESASKDLSKLNAANTEKQRALEQMVSKLGYIATTVHEMPNPVTLSGSELKGLRFEILRTAIIGFDGHGGFLWHHHEDFKPGMYRDFVHASLGEGTLDPKQPWAANMILAAHKNPAEKSAT